ncbi:MAG: potassium channel family protein, partial [Bacteroidota bacterium]
EHILSAEEVDANTVFACISGYLILGLSAAPLFLIIHRIFDGAFSTAANQEFFEFMYFSFITLTAIGYGDITPIHPIAKSLTLLIGIIGQLYLTFVVAIIIGKYLSHQ